MASAAPAPTHDAAVLWHELPDGSWHYDLLLAARPWSGPDDRCAHGFRTLVRPDQLAPGQRAPVQGLPPHRAWYLSLAGEVPIAGKGRARPLRGGRLIDRRGLPGDPASPPSEDGRFTVAWTGDSHALTYRWVNADDGLCVECIAKEPLT